MIFLTQSLKTVSTGRLLLTARTILINLIYDLAAGHAIEPERMRELIARADAIRQLQEIHRATHPARLPKQKEPAPADEAARAELLSALAAEDEDEEGEETLQSKTA
jgi:hypothetical protein